MVLDNNNIYHMMLCANLGLTHESASALKCFFLAHSPKTSLRAGGTHLAVLARSVMSYLNVSLENSDLDKVSKSLNTQTTRALMSVFK